MSTCQSTVLGYALRDDTASHALFLNGTSMLRSLHHGDACKQDHLTCFCRSLQELILFLQKLPTAGWGEKEVESVLSRAYMWRASFDHARSHLSQ